MFGKQGKGLFRVIVEFDITHHDVLCLFFVYIYIYQSRGQLPSSPSHKLLAAYTNNIDGYTFVTIPPPSYRLIQFINYPDTLHTFLVGLGCPHIGSWELGSPWSHHFSQTHPLKWSLQVSSALAAYLIRNLSYDQITWYFAYHNMHISMFGITFCLIRMLCIRWGIIAYAHEETQPWQSWLALKWWYEPVHFWIWQPNLGWYAGGTYPLIAIYEMWMWVHQPETDNIYLFLSQHQNLHTLLQNSHGWAHNPTIVRYLASRSLLQPNIHIHDCTTALPFRTLLTLSM